MKKDFVHSSPRFFNLIARSILACAVFVLVTAFFMPAPLKEAADPLHPPNPAKSAWFLLWIQELVSWSTLMIYPVLVAGLFFALLPWLPARFRPHRAQWLNPSNTLVNIISLLLFCVLFILTATALFFRGANWSFSVRF